MLPDIARGGDIDVTAADGDCSRGIDALAAIASTGGGEGSTGHAELAIGLHGRAAGNVVLSSIEIGVGRSGGSDGSTSDDNGAIGLQGFRTGTGTRGDDGAAVQFEESVALILVLRALVHSAEAHVDGIALGGDVQRAAIHLEALVDVEAVGSRLANGDGASSHNNIFIAGESMFRQALQFEGAGTAERGMSLDVERGAMRAACSVAEGVGTGEGDGDGLTILDVDGCTLGVGERETVEHDISLVVAIHEERAIGTAARERVGDLLLECLVLNDADLCSTGGDGDLRSDVTCDDDVGCRAAIGDADGIIGHLVIAQRDFVDEIGV